MWQNNRRDESWSALSRPFDLIVIGGGITGAGIFREASRAGLRTLLVEAGDFASGTSSRSAKMVHGGMRYLANLDITLTLESVRERERLLKQGKGLVTPLGFLFTDYLGDWPPGWILAPGLAIYDLLAGKWAHAHFTRSETQHRHPELATDRLNGGYHYFDAQADDARLVLRVLQEGQREGCLALNYARVETLLTDQAGQVRGVAICDQDPSGHGRTAEIQAAVVINATGCWADDLRIKLGAPPRLRRLRGSHLLFSPGRLPLSEAVSFTNPSDHRYLYAMPWEGAVLFGTTDIDHRPPPGVLDTDPAMSPAELDYLLEAARHIFPSLALSEADVLSTFSGVRSVVDTGNPNPSKESRDFVLWNEHGLLTVAGGKLTTFRLMAHKALRAVRRRLPSHPAFSEEMTVFDNGTREEDLPAGLAPDARFRMLGRYGRLARQVFNGAAGPDLATIGATPNRWVELRWSAQHEAVLHLDDLLLRRQRVGLLLPHGGLGQIGAIRAIAQPGLGWDDKRWEREVEAYRRLIVASYSVPGRDDHE